MPGGSVEHVNLEPGQLWLERVLTAWPRAVWINPVAPSQWGYTRSTGMIATLFRQRVFALTLDGLDAAMRALGR